MTQKFKRKQKLIQPALQLKMTGVFAGLTALGLLTQYVLLANRMTHLATSIPAGGQYVAERTPGMLLTILGVTSAVVLPLVVLIGVRLTFKIAGPLYRFEQHLAAVARGEDPGVCKIRKGDEMQKLCGLINDALAAARAGGQESESSAEEREAA